MSLILFLNIKGGVAKTTTTIGTAEALASLGRRVLVVDADHQCAASELLLGPARYLQADNHQETLHDLLRDLLDPEFDTARFGAYVAPEATNIRPLRPQLAVLPCSFRINDFQSNAAKAKRGFPTVKEFHSLWRSKALSFGRWLNHHYDHVIVDCPPSLAVQVTFFLRICDGYVVPCIPDRVSLRGARWLLKWVGKKNFKAKPLGLAWTLYREQNKHHKSLVGVVGKQAGRKGTAFELVPAAFKTIVPNATAVVAAMEAENAFPSLTAKYTSKIARCFTDLAKEIETAALVRAGKARGAARAGATP